MASLSVRALLHQDAANWTRQRRELELHIQRLRAGDVPTTHDVLKRLIDMTPVDDAYVVPRLVETLAHPAMEDESRRAIATAIERLFKRRETAFDGLVGLLAHTESRIRDCASQLLSRLVCRASAEEHAACVRAIAERLNDVSDSTRATSIWCLHDIVVNSGDLHRALQGVPQGARYDRQKDAT